MELIVYYISEFRLFIISQNSKSCTTFKFKSSTRLREEKYYKFN